MKKLSKSEIYRRYRELNGEIARCDAETKMSMNQATRLRAERDQLTQELGFIPTKVEEADTTLMEARNYLTQGEFDLALECSKRAQAMFESLEDSVSVQKAIAIQSRVWERWPSHN